MSVRILDTQIITSNPSYCGETRNVNILKGETIKFQTFSEVPTSGFNLIDEPNFTAIGTWELSGVDISTDRACVEVIDEECTGAVDIEDTTGATIDTFVYVATDDAVLNYRLDLSNYSIEKGTLQIIRQYGANPPALLVSFDPAENDTSYIFEDSIALLTGQSVTTQISYQAIDLEVELSFTELCVNLEYSVPRVRQEIPAVVGILPNTNYYLAFDKFGTGTTNVLFYNNFAGDIFVDDIVQYDERPEYFFRTNSEVDYTIDFDIFGNSCIDNVVLYEVDGYDLELYDCDGNEVNIDDKLTTYISGRTTDYHLDTSLLDEGCYYFVLRAQGEGVEDITTNNFCICDADECGNKLKIEWYNECFLNFQDGSFIDYYNLDNTQRVYVKGAMSRPRPELKVSGYEDCLGAYSQNIGSSSFSYAVTLYDLPQHLAIAVLTGTICDVFKINDERYILTEGGDFVPNENTNLYAFEFTVKKYQFGLINN